MHRRLAVLVCVLAVGAIAPAAASAAPTWAPASSATIHPGVQTYTEGGQCTANFVFYDAQRHLHRPGRPLLRHRRRDRHQRLRRRLAAARHPGRGQRRQPARLARLQLVDHDAGPRRDERDACDYNDFALVRLDPADHGEGQPVGAQVGRPERARRRRTALRDKVYSYGNSSLRGGVTQLSPKEGYSLGQAGDGWTHTVYTLTPGIPGDSGSAFLSKTGAALGTLSTVAIAPVTGSNGVGDMQREFNYMSANGGPAAPSRWPGHRALRGRRAAVGRTRFADGRGVGRARAAAPRRAGAPAAAAARPCARGTRASPGRGPSAA